MPVRAGYLDEAKAREWMRDPDCLRHMDEGWGISLLLVKPYAAIDLDRNEDIAEFIRLNPWAATTMTTLGGRGEKYIIKIKGDYPQRVLHVYFNSEHVGEFRGATTAILDNLHPSGKLYEVRNEGKIVEVAYDEIKWPAGWQVEAPRCREFQGGFAEAVEGGLLDLNLLKNVHPHPTKHGALQAFRLVEAWHPTVLMDEWDSLVGVGMREAVRGILNSGYRKGGKVPRCNPNTLEVELFSTFSPKAISGIGCLPGTAADRAITIHMRRRLVDEKIDRFRKFDGTVLRRKCARWCRDNHAKLEAAQPDMPDGMNDRQQDIWQGLFAIADLCGHGDDARKAALLLCENEDHESLGVQLLRDIREVFEREGATELPTATLLWALNKDEEAPWHTLIQGQPIHARRLGDMLRPFGISSKNICDERSRPKGYVLDHFKDAFARYLPEQDDTNP